MGYDFKLSLRDKGEFSELKFAIAAIEKGLRVSKPIFSGLPYDLIVDKEGSLFRVQIKSTSKNENKKFKATISYGNKQKIAYTPKDIDFFGIHVVPMDLWYIIPIYAIPENKKDFSSNPEDTQDQYHKYIENWGMFDTGEKQIITKSIHRRSEGNIYTDQKCSICGDKMKYDSERNGCFCATHPEIPANGRFRVCFGGNINKRTNDLDTAERMLNELRTKF